MSEAPLKSTPLHGRHAALGARLVPFAGYEMPVQYPSGIIAEHQATRSAAGLFDVSHMGQALLVAGDRRHDTVARALEALVPADLLTLGVGRQRYTQLLTETGGILDDLIVTRLGTDGQLGLVVNAARKEADYAHLEARLPRDVRLVRQTDRALIALQGPQAADAIARHVPGAAALRFMQAMAGTFDGRPCVIARSGYTGEDGFELSVADTDALATWDALLADPAVRPVGLGARDSLRLEAGLCLYGHDIDETTSPVEAALTWSIQKRRREEGGFPGAARVQRELREGPGRVRVGIMPEGRQPVREGAAVRTATGEVIGAVTSGGFGPTIGGPVAMGYVAVPHHRAGTPVIIDLRGKDVPAVVATLPFVTANQKR